jgi:hypothetical protein
VAKVSDAARWTSRETRGILLKEALKYVALTALTVVLGWGLTLLSMLFHLKEPLTQETLLKRIGELTSQLASHPYDLTIGLIKSDPVHTTVAIIISIGIVVFSFLLRRARRRINQLNHIVNDAGIAKALVAEAGLGGRWPHAKLEEGGAPWNDVRSEILRPENNILYILGANGVDTFGRPGSPLHDCLEQFRHDMRIILLDPQSGEHAGRARSLDMDPQEYRGAIRNSVGRLRELRQEQHSIEGRYYSGLPNWKLIVTSRTIWMQYYMPIGQHVNATPCWRFDLTATQDGLYHYFSMEFNRIWRRCENSPINL